MDRLIINIQGVAHLRDPRYATLWELAGPQTGLSKISIAFVEVDPGATSPLHWHEVTEETYMFTEGVGVMHLGDRAFPVGPGDCITIPIGVVHAIGAAGAAPLKMWVATSPPYTDDDDFEVEGLTGD